MGVQDPEGVQDPAGEQDPDAVQERLDLLDYRRRVAAVYARVRRDVPGPSTWRFWRGARDRLFRWHPQSPYGPDERARLRALPYFDYDPSWRVLADVGEADRRRFDIAHSADGTTPALRVATARFDAHGREHALALYWLDAYGGGLFLPFRDATGGDATYGGGRYLLDTVKGADLGMQDGRLLLDFNFAYHPSCVHDPRWSCPLAPPENRLDVAVRAGERMR